MHKQGATAFESAFAFDHETGDRVRHVVGLSETFGADYSLARLALLLSAPALTTGTAVESPWSGVRIRRPSTERTRAAVRPEPAEAAARIRHALGNHERASVLYTGTPADVVLLHHTASACRDDARELLVLVPEGLGPPEGTSLAIAATPLLAALAPRADIRILEPHVQTADTAWRPALPAIAPWEGALGAALTAARDWAAGVLLTSGGADDAYACPPYLRPTPGGLAFRMLPFARRSILRARRTDTGPVGAPYRQAVSACSAAWFAGLARLNRRGWNRNLEVTAADLRLIGRQPWYDGDGAELPPVAVPLLDPDLAGALLGSAGLYDRRAATPYRRTHAAVALLMPPELRDRLPAAPPPDPPEPVRAGELVLVEASGLVDPSLLPVPGGTRLASALRGVERWLRAVGR
ncbi:hypothetical protein [Rhizohabitans arisaemae]|uniref:hypothetical protein n=1 Tax=Rhizohabitans arisaemae TaxID=2720610 RepID=UPI0024B18115|nr:hypothetical protein [Rhizohabitans arisaemae]